MNIDLGKKIKNNAQAKKICFVSSLFQLLHSEMLRVHNLSGKKKYICKIWNTYVHKCLPICCQVDPEPLLRQGKRRIKKKFKNTLKAKKKKKKKGIEEEKANGIKVKKMEKIVPYCDKCNRKFASKGNLIMHVKKIHLNIVSYPLFLD